MAQHRNLMADILHNINIDLRVLQVPFSIQLGDQVFGLLPTQARHLHQAYQRHLDIPRGINTLGTGELIHLKDVNLQQV